jgi:hypothetical protein
MSGRKPHDKPTKATAESGEVMLDGPDGFALSMTPDAAKQSATAIAAAARKARQQFSKANGVKKPAAK